MQHPRQDSRTAGSNREAADTRRGDLRAGGDFRLEGNASGRILRCDVRPFSAGDRLGGEPASASGSRWESPRPARRRR
ncbi:MAG: hypothetical protein EHM90_01060 [Chloroflexi bacterium]|nr:MAG: hypothetical protein EHM90_01060 [Chloroflexota bacterium]